MSLEGFVPYVEGRTKLLIPQRSLGKVPPEMSPAFFNPRGKVVRDVSVIAFEAFARRFPFGAVLADPLAGVGGRSIRVAVECPSVSHVRANDLNPTAIQAAKLSAESNNCVDRIDFSVLDANHFMAIQSAPDSRPGIVDIDPFGTPAPYIDSAVRCLSDGGLLAVTATDTAVLSGLYPNVAYRKYGAWTLRTDYGRESMLRLVLGLVAHRALVYDMVMEPLFCHADQHYARAYCRLRISPSEANDSVERLGFLFHCFKCGHREAGPIDIRPCPNCRGKLKPSGPLWLGDLHDAAFLDEAMTAAGPGRKYSLLFARAKDELGLPPFYFKIPFLTDGLGIASVAPAEVCRRLVADGFRCVRSSVDGQGVKTDASIRDVLSALEAAQSLNPRQTR